MEMGLRLNPQPVFAALLSSEGQRQLMNYQMSLDGYCCTFVSSSWLTPSNLLRTRSPHQGWGEQEAHTKDDDDMMMVMVCSGPTPPHTSSSSRWMPRAASACVSSVRTRSSSRWTASRSNRCSSCKVAVSPQVAPVAQPTPRLEVVHPPY